MSKLLLNTETGEERGRKQRGPEVLRRSKYGQRSSKLWGNREVHAARESSEEEKERKKKKKKEAKGMGMIDE